MSGFLSAMAAALNDLELRLREIEVREEGEVQMFFQVGVIPKGHDE